MGMHIAVNLAGGISSVTVASHESGTWALQVCDRSPGLIGTAALETIVVIGVKDCKIDAPVSLTQWPPQSL
ncbi:hypothetical protein SCLCIDRAFT_1211881 [Scleroderma citrinum Foug A]|uniref:Uncharacterized protein n=1 Tax=Scleroderma citrinum Foug A TaxID=1036808 RepID=A0A0C3EC21_9AGAM|nr:hypothetical protein SCLCIDRAFT_1211881 [Scleroderma citrinum Foug A]